MGVNLPRDLVGMAILALLMERPRHPYEMQRVLRERRKEYMIGDARRLYHGVERLQKRGLIEPAEVVREGRRPERTVYQITEEGAAEFNSSLGEMIRLPTEDYPIFTSAVALLPYLSPEIVARALQSRIAHLEGEVAEQRTLVKGLKAQLNRLALLEVEYSAAMRQAEIEWVRALVDDIESGRLTWNAAELMKDPGLMLLPSRPNISAVPPRQEEA